MEDERAHPAGVLMGRYLRYSDHPGGDAASPPVTRPAPKSGILG